MKTKEQIIAYYKQQCDMGKQPKREVIEMLEELGMTNMAAAVEVCQIENEYLKKK